MSIFSVSRAVTGMVLALTALFAVTSAGADPPPESRVRNRPAESSGPIAVKIATDKKSYAVGEPIVLTMTVKNTTKESQHLDFASTQKYDFEIRKGAAVDGAAIWQWSHGMMFGQIVTSTPLAAGATLTYTVTLSFKSRTGVPAPAALTPGSYTVVGTLTTMPRTARPYGSIAITVK